MKGYPIMTYKLENLFGYRFFEKKEGPLVTIRKYTKKEVDEIGKRAGITNIQEIYDNRVIIENWLYRQFVKRGGNPKLKSLTMLLYMMNFQRIINYMCVFRSLNVFVYR